MKEIVRIDVDSYPVGLDVSEDGKYVIVTSQGRRDRGGNAVNIYRVDYAEPEEWPAGEIDASMALSRSNAEPESAADTTSALTAAKQESAEDTSNGKYLAAAICGGLLVLAATTAKLLKWKQPKG
jgi:DNA-binding beta-propeller fold protein YncE